jgi:tagaturonate reductase
LPVLITDDHKPYKTRKVRLLNGAHTTLCPVAYLAGRDAVRECMEDPVLCAFVRGVLFEEIIPTLTLPKAELEVFAAAVLDRFRNPFIDHRLLSISLNSVSKWRARVLPSVKAYIANNDRVPLRLAFGFAALLAFYEGSAVKGGTMTALRGKEPYAVQDDIAVLTFFADNDQNTADFVQEVCAKTDFWGEDLRVLPGFVHTVSAQRAAIREKGMVGAVQALQDALTGETTQKGLASL